ncbi:MAG: hypothetical protein NE327_09980 [Lentisphaeraceae bacterium]|nr:hypothetical protein [Lentisphaeraceae bacterium]
MRRVSLIFALIAIFCLFWADLEISSGDPTAELKKIAHGMLTPDFSAVNRNWDAILNTIFFAVCGISIGIFFGFIFSFFFKNPIVRLFLSYMRSIHEIFWVMLLMNPFGLTHFTAILGIAIPFTAIIGKVYAEIIEESDKKCIDALPHGTSMLSGFLFATLPGVWKELSSYTAYRFECALRSSAVIGFVGFPTLGYHLDSYFKEGFYSETAAMFYAFLVIIATWNYRRNILAFGISVMKKVFRREKKEGSRLAKVLDCIAIFYIPVCVIICFSFISWDWRFSVENSKRFFTEIIPNPISSSWGANSGLNWDGLSAWIKEIWSEQAMPGLWTTFILTQLALVATGIVTLIGFPFNSKTFSNLPVRSAGKFTSIFFRTVPEYVLAYVLILPLGPSLLPAIITIALHNGAIIMHLVAANADRVKLNIDSAKRKADLYLFEVLPRVYGQFLAFLFYRWEIIMRESAVLGVLGIATIGFYIDSAIEQDRLDRAFLLICLTAGLNMIIDALSGIIRKKMKISGRITSI